MTVTILKGSPDSPPKKITCRECKCVLQYEPSDTLEGDFGAMGDYEKRRYIKCPHCKNCVFVK
jgi:hypothetical protein